MERLAIAIQDQVDHNNWLPVKLTNTGPSISHLFFADDVLLFSKAKMSKMWLIQSLLPNFCLASGLKVNLAKSRAFAGEGVSRVKRERIMAITSILFTPQFDKYLG